MPRIRVLPYRQGSRSASALAEVLGGRALRLENSRFRKRPGDTIINWGSTTPRGDIDKNQPANIRTASNKLEFFRAMPEELIPRFWTRREDIPNDVYPIVCRTVLAGHSGDGIVIANSPAELVAAPLYVQYVKKKSEFRIHLGKRGQEIVTICRQKKVRRTDVENPNWLVRNHANGFIFQRNGIEVPEAVQSVAESSFANLELDFGAIDVIYNEAANRAYVLEVNTAPGLEGQTVNDYVSFFRGE